MLRIDSIDVSYGDAQVLKRISLHVEDGELIAVIGANGAGKSTLLKTISGILKPSQGKIFFRDAVISEMEADQIVSMGVIHVPEGRALFPGMTVRENLELGAYLLKDKKKKSQLYKQVFELFPILYERQNQTAGTFSGGEQQMLAIARGLMASPKLIMLDEPSLGLAPNLVNQVFELIEKINQEMKVSVILVEQNVQHSCEISSRAYVIENGEKVLEGKGLELLDNEHVRKAYMGL